MKNITFVDSKNRKWDYQIPFTITCTVTGLKKTYTSEEYINNKIERFNGLDKLLASYVCRDAKKGLKSVTTSSTTGKPEIKIGDRTIVVSPTPVVKMEFKAEKPTPITKESAPKDSCLNPAFLLDGNKCDKCQFNSICNYKDLVNSKNKRKAVKK